MPSSSCVIVGNVGVDPEMRYTPNGSEVVNFPVALYAGKDREEKKVTTWVRVQVWKDLAQSVNLKVKKGMKVQCSGFLLLNQYSRGDGSPGASIEMTAFNVGVVPKDIKFEDLPVSGGNGSVEVGVASEEEVPF